MGGLLGAKVSCNDISVQTAYCKIAYNNVSSTRELYHPLKDGEIRVLGIEPGTFDEPIHCNLSPCLLDDNPTYQALSYTWGDPSICAPIKVDGHVALRYLRDTEVPRVLWIDAVCINQEDIPERGMQVQQMRRIYKDAKDVTIWLGPPKLSNRGMWDDERPHVETESAVSSTSNHFAALKLLAGWFQSVERGETKSPHLDSENKDKWRDALKCEFWTPLKNPYWCRLWIIQEVALAKNPIVHCGSHSISFDDLVFAIRYASSCGTHYAVASGEDHWMNEYSYGIKELVHSRVTVATNKSLVLSDVLEIIGPHILVTDPRDRIYGLLGLADSCDIIPDYTLSKTQVYTQAAKHLLSSGDFNYLGVFSGYKDSSSNDSHSWATDLDIIAKHSFGVRPLTIYDNDAYCYKAATNLTPDLRFHDNDRILSARGVLVSDIDTCGQVMDANTHSHFEILSQWEDIMDSWKTRICSANSSWPYHFGPICGGWSEETLKRDDWQTSILNLRQARGSMKHQEYYVAGGTLTEAYCRTLLMNKVLSKSDTLERFYDDHVPEYNEDMGKPTPTEIERMSMLRESRMFDKYLEEAIRNQRLFITSKGYIGLGHQQIEKGDRLCVLYGSPVPYILRPHDDYWTVVGQCYAHGLMNGEIGKALECGEVTSQIFEIR
ncbi:uncharacterized protein EAF02_011568 [Botrytis sinoallii]|uniref:uncharacterized protein n=1 Tax=Botrytis sinoallii TaxID=1463999 RepID=UPI0018FFD705|nr:uncharacterized protein EAF02_011568 [Botrytis sinoallii]KAF7855309.1 hypothetical protein EAF02_011568 [Botrytis sinoallii]